MNQPNPQYPQQRRGLSGLQVVGVIFGGMSLLGLGTCVVCVGVVKKAGKEVEAAAASAQASASKQGEMFVPTLGKIAGNPTGLPPKATAPAKDETLYTYEDPKGTPIRDLTMRVLKSPAGAWGIDFRSETTLAPESFGTIDKIDSDDGKTWGIFSGPLRDTLLRQEGERWSVTSVPFAMRLRADVRLNAWACSKGKVPGVKPFNTSEFRSQCQEMVRKKLLLPNDAEFAGIFGDNRLITSVECGHTFMSTVEAKNAFGVKIPHRFTCTHDPKTDRVTLEMR